MRMVSVVWLALGLILFAGVARAAVCSEIVIGSALSLTGKYSTGGAHTRNGYEFAIGRLKATGGIAIGDKCYHFRVIYYDDESLPERGVQVADRLIEKDRVRFLLGPYSAAVAAAVANVAEPNKVPMLIAQGAPRELFRRGHKYLFGLRTVPDTYLDPVFELAAQIAAATGRKKSSIKIALAIARDPYTDDVRKTLRASAARHTMPIAVDERLPSDLADISTILSKVRLAQPDLLVVSGHAKGARTAIRQINEYQVHVPMIVMTHCEAAAVAARYKEAANSIVCAARDHAAAGNAGDFAKTFREKYKSYAARPIPEEVVQAATAIDVLAMAFQRAASLDSEKVRDALAATDMMTRHGRVKFSPDGGNIAGPPVVLRQIQDGSYNIVAPAARATHNLQWPRDGL